MVSFLFLLGPSARAEAVFPCEDSCWERLLLFGETILNHDGILTDFCILVNSPPLSHNLQICYQSEYDTYPQPVSMGFISITSGSVSRRGGKKLSQN